jgi:hypothetical protein
MLSQDNERTYQSVGSPIWKRHGMLAEALRNRDENLADLLRDRGFTFELQTRESLLFGERHCR